MKNSILIALLSTGVTLAAPSVSFADNNHSHKGNKIKSHKHAAKTPKAKFVKKHNNALVKHNKHNIVNHNVVRHNSRHNEPSFTFSWNVGDSTVTFGNAYNHNNQYQKPRGKKIYKRINRQAKRIQKGIHNGQLVKREAKKLRREQRHIRNTMAHFKRDGRLNRHERSQMHRLLDVANVNIHRKMTNRITRYSRPHNNHNNQNNYNNQHNNHNYYNQNTYTYGYAQF